MLLDGSAPLARPRMTLPPRLQHLLEPVPHIGRADALVIDLAVVVAAFLAREDLHRLLLRADGVEAFLRFTQWNLLVSVAVQHQERTADLLHDAVELERLEALDHVLL